MAHLFACTAHRAVQGPLDTSPPTAMHKQTLQAAIKQVHMHQPANAACDDQTKGGTATHANTALTLYRRSAQQT
jgi:hypothetical protein